MTHASKNYISIPKEQVGLFPCYTYLNRFTDLF